MESLVRTWDIVQASKWIGFLRFRKTRRNPKTEKTNASSLCSWFINIVWTGQPVEPVELDLSLFSNVFFSFSLKRKRNDFFLKKINYSITFWIRPDNRLNLSCRILLEIVSFPNVFFFPPALFKSLYFLKGSVTFTIKKWIL